MKKHTCTCPHCLSTQQESASAISTYCRNCNQYYKIEAPRKRRLVRLPRENRVFTCQTCQWSCRAVPSAISTQCENCGIYLDLRSYRIVGTNGDPLFTYGSIEFASTCAYRAMEAVADQIFVAGRVHAGLRAFTSIELQEKGSVRGWQRAPLIRVVEGASVVALHLEADVVEVFGMLQADTVRARHKLKIHAGGVLVAREISCAGLEVARGAALKGQIYTLQPDAEMVPEPQPVTAENIVLKRETNESVSRAAFFFLSESR
ncbi:MAG: hypothetical protein ACAI35_16605 [Candidatus Methylacidiphilales bacterium]|nr:polymer-forming cytoskeletal protein [Candidatus Methylacidiphilales bacterium]